MIARLADALSGRYRVQRPLGEGGMATVYLAEDVKHRRRVALKVLRPELAAAVGAERFLAEIETTANLQHPHILPLFDSGQADGLVFYVMPYVEGETLRDRLDREKQLPVEEALRIAVRVAGALHYAHERGVIHRDIKPANVLLSGGQPLVADFGIALAVSEAGGGRLTETGLSLGTPHYMSPEQASGERTLDARSDVYALGCVLYEMLTGNPPHTGPTAQAVLASVLTTEPPPVTGVRRTVPPHVDAAVAKALEKLPADRFTSAEAFARALEDPGITGRSPAAPLAPPRARRWGALAAGAASLAVISFFVGRALSDSATASAAPAHLTVQLPPGVILPLGSEHPVLALSPDGTRLVFVGDEAGTQRLYLRALSDPEARPLPGTEGATAPFFSPDGARVAFFSGSTLKRLRLPDGPAEVAHAATPTTVNRGAAWLGGDSIVYAASRNSGLQASSLAGARVGSHADWAYVTDGMNTAYAWPHPLPGGRRLLLTESVGANLDEFRILSLSRGDRSVTPVVNAGSYPLYSPTGHLLFARAGALWAVPFDVGRASVTGPESRVLEGVVLEPDGAAHVAISASGSLAYVGGAPLERRDELVWVDRSGTVVVAHDAGRTYGWPRLSPDGSRAALTISTGANTDVWILDLARGALQRVTTDPGEDFGAVWSPDGTRIALSSEIDKPDEGPGMAWTLGDAFEVEPLLHTPGIGNWEFPTSWSPDGAWLAFTRDHDEGSSDIEMMPTTGERAPVPFAATDAREVGATFSPDGRWVAFVSDGSGRNEVFAQPFPGPGRPVQLSTAGGVEPMWSRDGRELFYRQANALVAVSVDPAAADLAPGTPVVLFEGRYELSPYGGRQANYDVSPDGRRFLMVRRKNLPEPTSIQIVLSWPEALLVRR